MSKLDEAEQRLQRAVAGLENAASAAVASAASIGATPAPDPEAALETAQARTAELEDANAAIARRLDGAIARIKTILDH